jgi:cyanate permease
MTRPRRDSADAASHLRSHATCYLALGMGGSLAAALLGSIYEQRAVWAAGLAVFALLCLQGACGYYWRERPVVAVIVVENRPLSSTTM